MLSFDTFKNNFIIWIKDKVEKKSNTNFSICPYARSARLKNSIFFVDSRDKFVDVPLGNYEIIVHWLGNEIDKIYYKKLIAELSSNNSKNLYFLSTPESGYFVQNFTNCIFVQDKGDIIAKRSILQELGYYDDWPKDYYNEIMEIP